jgi:hypothetical protein
MAQIQVSAVRDIDAPPATVYSVISDYQHRNQWLPPAFHDYGIDSGGSGGGTEFHYRLMAGRRARGYHMISTETAPGSVLTEQDRDSSLVTQ